MGKVFEVKINTDDEVREVLDYLNCSLDYEDFEVNYVDEE